MADKYADKRPGKTRACRNQSGLLKQRFRTEAEAELAAADPRRAGVCTAYECPECGWWHIGKPSHRSQQGAA